MSEAIDFGDQGIGASDFPAQFAQSSWDLDGDGVSDPVMCVPKLGVGQTRICQLRVLNGRDGTTLWAHELDMRPDRGRISVEMPTPAVADLNGDGKPEVAVSDYAIIVQSPTR